jgi:hypothetical protein
MTKLLIEQKQYEWDTNYRQAGRVDPQKAGEALTSLAELDGQRLTTESVVEYAKPKRSPLHGGFEWDDALAATEHRQLQARQMMKSLRVIHVDREEQEPTRVFLNVRYGDGSQSYATVDHIMDDDDLYASVLGDAVSGLKAWQRRYRDIKELKHIHDAITAL